MSLRILPSVHFSMHCVSCGQTRPQTLGSRLVRLMMAMASPSRPSAIALTKPGMSISTGHPATQGFAGHCRQRMASTRAIASV